MKQYNPLPFITYLLLLIMSFPMPTYADTTTGLVGWWRLNEGSGTSAEDSSGKGNTGTLFNSPTWVPGVRGTALSFNGTSDAVATGNIDLTGTKALTLTFWLKTNSFANDDALAAEISTNYNIIQTGIIFDVNSGAPCSGSISVAVNGDVGYNDGCYTRPSVGIWHHYAAIFDKSQVTEVRLYIDGILQTPTSNPNTNDNTNNFGNLPLYLMSRATTSLFKAGFMDDVRIYNRALSAQDVYSLYLADAKIRGAILRGFQTRN